MTVEIDGDEVSEKEAGRKLVMGCLQFVFENSIIVAENEFSDMTPQERQKVAAWLMYFARRAQHSCYEDEQ